MTDVLFRYLLMARERDQHWYQRVFLADERLLAAGVERVVETAAIVVRLQAQEERVSRSHVVMPRSAADRCQFYDKGSPTPPVGPVPESRTERFALQRTLTFEQCLECKTTGRVPCLSCGGHGAVPCICAGESITACIYCGGKAQVRCVACSGHGEITHERCSGEGELAKWEEEVHTYSVRWLHDAHFPSEAPPEPMARAVDQWIRLHPEPLAELTAGDVVAHLGYDTPEVSLLLAAAERGRNQLEARAQSSTERCLFLAPAFYIVPVAACVLRSERRSAAVRYWLVGRGEDAIEIPPDRVVDRWKLAGWSGLGAALVGAQSATETLGGVDRMICSSLALGGLAVGALGLWRLMAGRTPVRTVAVLRAPESRLSFLPCLATLGAFTRQLEVQDRTYRPQLEAMMGGGATGVTRSLVIKVARGQLVRFTEIEKPNALTQGELARMAEAVDGIVLLEEPGRSADAIRSRIHGATTARPPEARLRLDPGASAADLSGATPDGSLAIEWVRRVFMRELEATPDWARVFEQMWRPVGTVLAGSKRPALWPASQIEAARAR